MKDIDLPSRREFAAVDCSSIVKKSSQDFYQRRKTNKPSAVKDHKEAKRVLGGIASLVVGENKNSKPAKKEEI